MDSSKRPYQICKSSGWNVKGIRSFKCLINDCIKNTNFIFILIAIIALYLLRTSFSEYNLKKTVSACILAQKQTSQSFNLQKAKKFCEEEIRKSKKD